MYSVFLNALKFYFYRLHLIYFRFIYRLIIVVSHRFGIRVMILNLFRPLFGFLGFISRINGFVFRLTAIALGSLILLVILAIGIMIYPVVIYGLFKLLITSPEIFVSLILLLFVAYYLYYLGKPVEKLGIDTSDLNLKLTGCNNTRKILMSLISGNTVEALNRIFDDKNLQDYMAYIETDPEEYKNYLMSLWKSFNVNIIIENIKSIAVENKIKYSDPVLILVSFIKAAPNSDVQLGKNGLTFEDILSAYKYVKFLDSKEPRLFDEDFKLNPAGGIDKGWAVGYTEELNKYSVDLTKMALKGEIPTLIGRTEVKNQVIDILSKPSRNNVLLIGEPGCGKSTFVKALAKEIATGVKINTLNYKRVVSLDVGSLTSGSIGDVNKRLTKIVKEITQSGNVILFIDEIQNLSSIFGADPNAVAAFGILEPYLSSGKFQFIGASTQSNYRKYIQPNEVFSKNFDIVEMRIANETETNLIIQHDIKTKWLHKIYLITYPAIKDAISYAQKFVSNRVLPDSAVEVINRGVSYAKNNNIKLIDSDLIAKMISESVGVSVSKITQSEKEKLLTLEKSLSKRVIGQHDAIKQISNAVKRSRVEIEDSKRPIGSFLFIGPTGVGKTETAKALAEAYFGSEDNLLRFDMSEFQEISSINRLIGSESGEVGRLTSSIKMKPYTLILIDEIEKAHPNILNLFLQVLDEGFLTDALGNKVSFTHTFIIMTSNAGARQILEALGKNSTYEEIRELIIKESQNFFSPEFLNRFTSIIPFNALTPDNIKDITKIKLNKVIKTMQEKYITLTFSEDAINEIARLGYTKEWGARPLNRVVEEKVETGLAEKIISGELKKGSSYNFTVNDIK